MNGPTFVTVKNSLPPRVGHDAWASFDVAEAAAAGTAVTALGISVLHGLIFWVVRRRQRRVRQEAIVEIREMLADVVKNQLAAIGMSLPADAK